MNKMIKEEINKLPEPVKIGIAIILFLPVAPLILPLFGISCLIDKVKQWQEQIFEQKNPNKITK